MSDPGGRRHHQPSGSAGPRWWHRARGSVRVRVTLLAAGAFAVTLAVAAFVLLRSLERVLVDDLREADQAALIHAATIVESGSPGLFVSGATGPPSTIALGDRTVFVVSTSAGGPSVTEQLRLIGAPERYLVETLTVPDGPLLATATPLDGVRATIRTTGRLLWIVGPALVALVAGLAWMLATRALRPVRLLIERVSSIEPSSLHERVPVPPAGDEITALATTMNEMLGRLDTASTASRRLVSDASHELRTPIAVMRTELEVAQRSGGDLGANGAVLAGELDRLQHLVDDLLLLARGDERTIVNAEVDLVDVVHEVAGRRRRVPVQVEIDVGAGDAAGAVPGRAFGDRAAIARAVDHLVANAARSADSAVVVTLAAAPTSAGGESTDRAPLAIHVDDDGPGIPEADRARVVERFVRLDEGRSRDHGGAGLGLAVAADVAAAHGGRLAIGDSPLGGARVSLTISRRSAREATPAASGGPNWTGGAARPR